MHKIGPRRIIEQRTFAYDDLIRGSTMKSFAGSRILLPPR